MPSVDPYDELPYLSLPVEWTAPERLSLASLLHGGPRAPRATYRVLELGCADGANLLPMACHRQHASFVGVDRCRRHIDAAKASRASLQLSNVKFLCEDFLHADALLEGEFDYIIAHGVFSWVADDVRDALLHLCAKRLRPGGLLYLNYNAHPGWKVRGLVRDFLLVQTAGLANLSLRAAAAREAAAKVCRSLVSSDHPFSRLIANEFDFVCKNHPSYVAHEYLAVENHAYWRSEFLALAATHRFEYVADADFNYPSGRMPEDVTARLLEQHITGRTADDTVDLLSYRQLHSPILTLGPLNRQPVTLDEFAGLTMASCLDVCELRSDGKRIFLHSSGYEVEVKEDVVDVAFRTLRPIWPQGLAVGDLFSDVSGVIEDLKLLYRNGLIELRCVDPNDDAVGVEVLNRLEAAKGGYYTTRYHTRVAAVA